MSLGELMFKRQLAGVMYDEDEGKQSSIVKSFSSSDNRPLFRGSLNSSNVRHDVVILIDSGATSSFINSDFTHKNNLVCKLLQNEI
jgi:hypothetical protein